MIDRCGNWQQSVFVVWSFTLNIHGLANYTGSNIMECRFIYFAIYMYNDIWDMMWDFESLELTDEKWMFCIYTKKISPYGCIWL